MTARRNGLSLSLALLVAVLATSIGIGLALAVEQPSAQDIIDALKPPRITRGLTTSPAGAARAVEESRFVDTLRNRTTRSLTTEEREKIASIANSKPKIDLEINFEFNSAIIAAKALPQVTALGEALTSPDLKARTFIVAGHTDAKGSETYNQGLSERRADAVKRFLSEKHGIETNRLLTVGYGATNLKNPESPLAGENRRVQIVNTSDK
jgi:outer membrane protein OmpA-like peptidoglycan-associated protein